MTRPLTRRARLPGKLVRHKPGIENDFVSRRSRAWAAVSGPVFLQDDLLKLGQEEVADYPGRQVCQSEQITNMIVVTERALGSTRLKLA